jgi:hypothetical protein
VSEEAVRQLGPDETDRDHPCTDTRRYGSDLDLLAYLLQDLRGLMRSHAAGKTELVAHQPTVWQVHGLRRRVVVCEPDLICARDRVCVVGFFGERREDIDYESLEELELTLLLEFRRFPGILSYSSMELANEYWANLVVHSEPDDTDAWRTSQAHARAVGVSPRLYSSVRIHNGHLEGGIPGSHAIAIDRTKYWDYSVDPVWHAVREFDPPLARTRRQIDPVDVGDPGVATPAAG